MTRRLGIFLICATLFASVGVQTNHTGIGGATTPAMGANGGTATYGASTVGASMLFVAVTSFQATACTISDTVGATSNANAWNQLTLATNAPSGGNTRLLTFYAYAKTGGGALVTGASHSVTLACTSSFAAMEIAAATGTLTTSDPLDQQAEAHGTGSGTLTVSLTSPATNGYLVLTAGGNQTGAATTNSPFTQLDSISGGGFMSGVTGWVASSGTQTSNLSLGSDRAAKIVSFKAAPVGQPSIMMIQGEDLR